MADMFDPASTVRVPVLFDNQIWISYSGVCVSIGA